MKRGRNIFWGVLFLLGAVAVIISRLGYLQGLGFWSVLITVFLAGFLINGVFKRNWGQILFSLAFIGIVNARLLGIEKLVPWTLLLAALLGTIGLNMLLPRRRLIEKHHFAEGKKTGDPAGDDVVAMAGEEEVHYQNSFGSAIKYFGYRQLEYAHLESSFGLLEVYFDNAVLKDQAGLVKVEPSFGVIRLYVPASWRVIIDVNTNFGGVEESGCCDPAGKEVLTVTGDISFGCLQIHYT